MCFFALLYRLHDEYPLIVAANRDEFLDRPGTRPFELRPGVLAGQDPRSGGTWLGVNRRGLIVAVTNLYELGSGHFHPPTDRAGRLRSRGLLCLDLLELGAAAGIEAAVREQLARHAYSDFNVIAADRTRAVAATLTRGALAIHDLAPGLHIVANTTPDNPADPKVARGRTLLAKINRDGPYLLDDLLEKLKRVCADHGGGTGEDSICVHAPGRGTLSSTIIALHRDDPGRHRYLFADAPPCRRPYEQVATDWLGQQLRSL